MIGVTHLACGASPKTHCSARMSDILFLFQGMSIKMSSFFLRDVLCLSTFKTEISLYDKLIHYDPYFQTEMENLIRQLMLEAQLGSGCLKHNQAADAQSREENQQRSCSGPLYPPLSRQDLPAVLISLSPSLLQTGVMPKWNLLWKLHAVSQPLPGMLASHSYKAQI